jgi:glycosyltransferase involved in cell wall biosynthesis
MELIVEGGKPRGGAAVQTMVWMQAFHELGFEVYLAKFENDNRKLLAEFDWVKPISIYHPDKFKKRLTWFTYRFPSIYKALKKSGSDYLYISIPRWTTFYLGIICKILGIKKIIRIANDNVLDNRIFVDHKRVEAFFIKLALQFSDLTFTQNEFQYQTVKKRFPKNHVFKIFNPVIIDYRFLKPKNLSNEGYIAWVANFRYQKNLSLLYQIAKNITDINFKIAGEPLFPMDDETKDNIDLLKRLPNVEFVGILKRNEVLPFLSNANFLLNTSRYEGFSNTFLEAMLTGTPILTTSNVNPDGIIDKYSLGFTYNNDKDLIRILEGLPKENYLSKSKNCIHFVKENHDHIFLGKRIIKLISKL